MFIYLCVCAHKHKTILIREKGFQFESGRKTWGRLEEEKEFGTLCSFISNKNIFSLTSSSSPYTSAVENASGQKPEEVVSETGARVESACMLARIHSWASGLSSFSLLTVIILIELWRKHKCRTQVFCRNEFTHSAKSMKFGSPAVIHGFAGN